MLERRKGPDVPPQVQTVRDRIAFRRRTDDLETTLFRLNRWWDALCSQEGLDPKRDVWQDFGYHIDELVKNGLLESDGVEVYSVFAKGAIGVVVQDNGPGLSDPEKAATVSIGQGYGLQSAIAFADSVVIESLGRRYEKRLGSRKLTEGQGPVVSGTRVSLFKRRSATR